MSARSSPPIAPSKKQTKGIKVSKPQRHVKKSGKTKKNPTSDASTPWRTCWSPSLSHIDLEVIRQPVSRDEMRKARDSLKLAKWPKRPRRQYSVSDLEAVEKVQVGALTYRDASSLHKVPVTTIHDRVNGKHTKAVGRPYGLSQETEIELASLIRTYCAKGNVLERSFFCEIARNHVARIHPDINFQAHSDWLFEFLKRHDLKEFDDGASKSLGVHRIISCSESIANSFCRELLKAYSKYLQSLAQALNTTVPELQEDYIRKGIFAIDGRQYQMVLLCDMSQFARNTPV